MRRLLPFAVLLALAVPAAGQSTIVLDPKDCHGDPFTFMGKRVCWGERDNTLHPVKGRPPRVGPWLKLSFSLPVGPLPTYNAFNPSPYELNAQEFGRQGLREGDIVTNRTLDNNAYLHDSGGNRSWGVRARVRPGRAPIAIDISWTKLQPARLIQIFSGEFVTTGRYYEDCPAWADTQPCTDFGGKFVRTSQYNDHRVQLHVFRAGIGYDLMNSFGFVSLEPGLGIELSTAKNVSTVLQQRYTDSYEKGEVIQDRQSSDWLAPNVAPYASLSVDVYPLGKDRWLALGVSTRFLFFRSDYWSFRDGTLLMPYEVPIRSRRWSTSLYATLAF